MSDLDDFTNLSKFLLGLPLPDFGIQDLPADLTAFYFQLLSGSGDADFQALLGAWQIEFTPLTALGQALLLDLNIVANSDLWQRAQKLIMLWYTGVWDPASSNEALKYPDPTRSYPFTLVWVMSQSHPRSITKGFGYWQSPPSESGS
jgi:hypothetical protein